MMVAEERAQILVDGIAAKLNVANMPPDIHEMVAAAIRSAEADTALWFVESAEDIANRLAQAWRRTGRYILGNLRVSYEVHRV